MAEITYRNLRPSDFADVHSYASLWPVVRQLGGWPWPPSEAFTRSRCQPYDKGPGFVWAVCLDARVMGTVGVTAGPGSPGHMLGYTFHPDAHGQGIGSRAARDAVAHAFATDPELSTIRASTWHDNPASHRILLRLGFRQWQTRFVPSPARGVPNLCRHYKLRRTDWPSNG